MNTEVKLIKNKLELLNLAEELGNVSQACKVMDYSRGTFYRFCELYDKGGELALREISRRKPILGNRVEVHIEEAVIRLATDSPLLVANIKNKVFCVLNIRLTKCGQSFYHLQIDLIFSHTYMLNYSFLFKIDA
jgi:hypothetical protein